MTVLVKPAGQGAALIVVFSISVAIITVVNALRVYVRLRIIKNQRTFYEDLSAGLGWLLLIFVSGLAIAETFYGSALPLYLIPPENFVIILKITWAYDMSYVVAQMAIKQSISLMLLRYSVEQYHKKAIYMVTTALHAMSLLVVALIVFQCIPLSYFWTRGAGDINGRCIDTSINTGIAIAYSVIIVVYDVVMAILPWLMVRKLQLDLRSKLMVTVVLALGSVACIATFIRVPFIIKLSATEDSRTETIINMISASEMALSITASSTATLKPLFRRRSAQSNSSSYSSGDRSGKIPVLNTIQTTTGSSSVGSGAKESDMEFATAFYGGVS